MSFVDDLNAFKKLAAAAAERLTGKTLHFDLYLPEDQPEPEPLPQILHYTQPEQKPDATRDAPDATCGGGDGWEHVSIEHYRKACEHYRKACLAIPPPKWK